MEVPFLFGMGILLLAFNIPIAAALGAAAIATIWVFGIVPLDLVPSIAYATVSKFTILAVPYFIAAGYIMERSGIADRLIRLAGLLVGALPGGLAYVAIVVSIFFAGISGSGTADTAALGAILIPAMGKAGYNKAFSAALIACGGSIGIIVPPSITYVLYGSITGASIGKLFVAGIIPGILIGLSLALPSYISTRHIKSPGWQRGSHRDLLAAARDASWGLAAPFVILGGIYGGIFTPTEAAGIVVVYAVAVGMLVYRELPRQSLPRFFADSALITSMALVIVIGASLFSWIITRLGISAQITHAVSVFSSDPQIIVIVLMGILLITGMFLDAVSITFIFIPLFLPLLQAAQIDLVWFGVLYSVNMAIGQATPPVGVNLYIAAGIARVPFAKVSQAILPMIAGEVVVLAILVFFPELTLWLPNIIGMR
ncbi:MAG: TRAP transporter large permease [Desulfobacteraceae bacterium]|nr:MAG: TRAP transporter large permease [Desulfobacteraceae bacterium]